MTLKLDPATIAISTYATVANTGIFKTRGARKLFLQAYYFYKKHFEDPFFDFTNNYPHLLRNGHILDVGANIGYTSSVFAKFLNTGYKVFAFEPEPNNVSLLLEAITDRDLQHKICPVSAAVGANPGVLELWINNSHHGDHRILTEDYRARIGNDAHSQTVQLVSIDSFLSEHAHAEPVSFIKIDVQGYELEVCHGMEKTLEANRDVSVAFEYSPDSMKELGFVPEDLLHFFTNRGFNLYLLDRTKRLRYVSPGDLVKQLQSRPYTDILATRRNLVAAEALRDA